MRPVDKSRYTDNRDTYNPYAKAKEDLIEALGSFCSYCERKGYFSSLDVEHIEDKANNPQKKYDWGNFLLACRNCNPTKGTKPVDFDEILMPHIDNTFILFAYLESGLIGLNPSLNDILRPKAKALMDLIGLDRLPGHPKCSPKDKRWQERKKAWELAKRYLDKFNKGIGSPEIIKDLALQTGFWSIWMTVFEDHADIKTELVDAFPGTRLELFNQA